MSVKGSKSAAVKVVKKIKRDLAAMKKPITKAAKKIAKDISMAKKPTKSTASKSVKKAPKRKVGGVKKLATKVAKTTRKVVKPKKAGKSLAKKRPTLKRSTRRVAKKASAPKKTGTKVKKKAQKSSKAKAGKKVGKAKKAGAVKSKKSAKKAKAVKKNKSAKEEKAEIGTAVKKKLAIFNEKPKKVASIGGIKKVASTAEKQKVAASPDRLIEGGAASVYSTSSARGAAPSKISRVLPSVMAVPPPATSLMGGISPYKEKAGEEYMNETQQAHFRKLLKTWKEQLMQDMMTTVHHMQDEAANFPDPNDRATQEEEFSLELRTRDRELKLIKKIEEAMHKLDNHEYGYCDSCGVKIGIRRLEARPTATLCIDCKTLDEIREKQVTG